MNLKLRRERFDWDLFVDSTDTLNFLPTNSAGLIARGYEGWIKSKVPSILMHARYCSEKVTIAVRAMTFGSNNLESNCKIWLQEKLVDLTHHALISHRFSALRMTTMNLGLLGVNPFARLSRLGGTVLSQEAH